MKKFALALMASAALVFGFGAVAQAQYGSASATFNFPSFSPGQTVIITINGCAPGERITITVNGSVVTVAICAATTSLTQGSLLGIGLVQQTATAATATFTAPSTPGTYSVGLTGDRGFSFTASLTVVAAATTPATTPGGGLPATGSSGMGTTTSIAIGLLAVGAGLFFVAQVRRRQPSPA